MAVTADNFAYKRYFPLVSPTEIEEAITEMSVVWAGTQLMWDATAEPLRTSIRDMVMNLLVAWHLADFYTDALEGIAANGGMPLTMKSMGGVDVKFAEIKVQPALSPLLTNTFGIRAAQMIMSAPERFGVRGKTPGVYYDVLNTVNPLGI
jgi:hypothetical protein